MEHEGPVLLIKQKRYDPLDSSNIFSPILFHRHNRNKTKQELKKTYNLKRRYYLGSLSVDGNK